VLSRLGRRLRAFGISNEVTPVGQSVWSSTIVMLAHQPCNWYITCPLLLLTRYLDTQEQAHCSCSSRRQHHTAMRRHAHEPAEVTGHHCLLLLPLRLPRHLSRPRQRSSEEESKMLVVEMRRLYQPRLQKVVGSKTDLMHVGAGTGASPLRPLNMVRC